QAEAVAIPENVEELVDFLKSNRHPITIAGAGTGVTASRIPSSGTIISLERLNPIGEIESSTIDVGPAARLADLESRLQTTSYFYPPNPTEMLAFIGGTIATNASGPRSYKYGATRDYVLELELVLADGRRVTLPRGHKISKPLVFDDGSAAHFPAVQYRSPSCKNAAGYYVQPEMDWVDLFIGSDGTLGIVVRAKLKLLPRPFDFVSGIVFFADEESSWRLVDRVRSSRRGNVSPCSIEYFDRFSLKRLKRKYDAIPNRAQAALFMEQDVASKKNYDPLLEEWYDFLNQEGVLLDDSWFAQSQKDIRRFQEFRHAVPLMINEENSRLGRVKIGTDMAVGNERFMDMMRYYRERLTDGGLDYVAFGHIGDNHLHINLLPGKEETERARRVCQTLIDQILKWNGTISAEHGIGKLKKEYFRQMVGEQALEELKRIKKTLDPRWLLGVGNIL
ncbi:MAG: FAD-binding oxidoreductase, partial [Nitrospinales bacterium]